MCMCFLYGEPESLEPELDIRDIVLYSCVLNFDSMDFKFLVNDKHFTLTIDSTEFIGRDIMLEEILRNKDSWILLVV